MSRAVASRIGQAVKIKAFGGMPQFYGKTGRIVGIEVGMYRVRLDEQVIIPGLEPVTDDLWEGRYLQTLRAKPAKKNRIEKYKRLVGLANGAAQALADERRVPDHGPAWSDNYKSFVRDNPGLDQ